MMPLTLASRGDCHTVRKVTGDEKMKKHLSDMGIAAGRPLRVISVHGDDVIVEVASARLALNGDLAKRIKI